MKHIDYKKLKGYDIGKMPTDSGYQRGTQGSTLGFTNTPGYNMSNEVSTVRNSTIPTALTQASTLGKNIYDMVSNTGSMSKGIAAGMAANAANNAAITSGTAKMTVNGLDLAAGSSGQISVEGLKDAGQIANDVASSGLNAAGYAAGALGAAVGTYGIINDAIGFSDRLRENDMMKMSGRGTASKYGVQYNTYGGLDASGIKKYTDAQNTQGTLSMTMNGAGTGSSIGGMVGSIIPGVGTVLGTVAGGILGGIGGLIGGLAGSSSRSDKVEESIKNTLAMQSGYNLQEESKAGSKGLRNQYNITHADKGKNITLTNNGQQGELRMVHTSEGIVPGIMLGLAGKGESIYDPIKGTASVFEEGKKRVDNIPTGVSLNEYKENPDKFKYDSGGAWNRKVIFGNKINPTTGNSFADDAKPYAKILENTDKEDMKYLNKHTKEINRMNAMKQLNRLADVQSDVTRYNCGKAGKYYSGKPVAPEYTFLQAPFMLKEYYDALKQTPYAANSFVENPTARQALDILGSMKYDPTYALNQLHNASRQNIYSINQAGGLNSAQKEMLKSSANNDLARQRMSIYDQKQQMDNNTKQSYASALDKYGTDFATRLQSATSEQNKMYAGAVGAKQKWTSNALKNMSQIIPGYLQNRSTYDQFMAMYDLYNRQVNNDTIKIKNDIENSKRQHV